MTYSPKDENSGNNVYATVILKNYTWSGAVTVANVLLTQIILVKSMGIFLCWLWIQRYLSGLCSHSKQ